MTATPSHHTPITWIKSHWMILTTGVICLLVGSALGATAQPEAKTTTKTVNHTVTKTETVEVTPKACVTTINGLVKASQITSRAAGRAIIAGVNRDAAGIDVQTARIHEATRIIKGITPEYSVCMANTG